ncbi:MAG: radical SAM protein [Deltaproteobacteria bacterium]|nr:radical SAM protein [Deltaproteobacteria bacterium]MCL5792353.1 radical SAM protein [Deltaproteobacteria bacterium]
MNTIGLYPSYLNLMENGEFEKRIHESKAYLSLCRVCPRNCMTNRLDNKMGVCLLGRDVRISSYNVHNGEEPPISGINGSGAIFFSGCILRCKFCQNYPISQKNNGVNYTIEDLADMMLELQAQGVHNVNLITPTHFIPHIIEAIYRAALKGLRIPIVYNTGGYESVGMLKLLDGIIDIYLPDIKYSDDRYAFKYSSVKDYVEVNRQAIAEMYRQVGGLILDSNDIAIHGLIVRHLVLPYGIAGTCESMAFIAGRISENTYISLMNQYFPANRAYEYKELSRKITREEYIHAVQCLEKNGLENGWIQE